MFESFGRSWQFATTSYKVLWNNKQLIVFPLLSTAAAAVVVASFLVPLWATGELGQWLDNAQQQGGAPADVGMYITLFCFYFCNYFVIVFFNSALIACVMQVLNGEQPTIQSGLAVAARRLPQITGWALVSALVGVALRAIENSNKRAGELIAGLLGTAWTAMTFFVIPAIVLEGVGPVEAVRRSLGTLKSTWGTALVGNFSLGLVGLVVLLPLYLVAVGLAVLGMMSGSPVAAAVAFGFAAIVFVLASAVSSAAGTVFTALLFSFATGRTVPADVDTTMFAEAFVAKK
ncbi:MAG: hypothetical protein JW809_11770 [Pirellulales bacterium]|nr:hypothetical protein [Pirellulales bacterium]